MKTTPLHEIPELEDKIPVLAVEGTVKVALDVQNGTTESTGNPWSRQFFVLAQGNDEVGCTLWDAEGNEMKKGEHVRIEATQNKKKQWTGMLKGSYEKNGERKHTLEIRANNVKITDLKYPEAYHPIEEHKGYVGLPESQPRSQTDPDWPEAPVQAPESSVPHPSDSSGITDARKHLMQAANLYNLCVDCVNNAVAPWMPNIAQTSEQFQATVGTLFIEASRAGYVGKMPSVPLKK